MYFVYVLEELLVSSDESGESEEFTVDEELIENTRKEHNVSRDVSQYPVSRLEVDLSSSSLQTPPSITTEQIDSQSTGLTHSVPNHYVPRDTRLYCYSASSSDLSDSEYADDISEKVNLKANNECAQLQNCQSSFVFHSNFLDESSIILPNRSLVLEEKHADVDERKYSPLQIDVNIEDDTRRESGVSDASSGLGPPLFARLPPDGRENPDQFIIVDGLRNQDYSQLVTPDNETDINLKFKIKSEIAPEIYDTLDSELSLEEELVLPTITKRSESQFIDLKRLELPTCSSIEAFQQLHEEPTRSSPLIKLPKRASSFTNIATIDIKEKSSTLPPSAKTIDMDPFLTSPRTWTDFSARHRRASIGSVESDGGDRKTFAPPLQFTKRESMIDKIDRTRRESVTPRLKGLNIPGKKSSTSRVGSVLPTLKPLKAFTPINYKPEKRQPRITGGVRQRPRSMIAPSRTGEDDVDTDRPVEVSFRNSVHGFPSTDESEKYESMVEPAAAHLMPYQSRASTTGPVLKDQTHEAVAQKPLINSTINTVVNTKLKPPPVPKKPIVSQRPANIVINAEPEISGSNTEIKSPLSPTSTLPRPYRPVSIASDIKPLSQYNQQANKDYSLKSPVYREGPKPFIQPTGTLHSRINNLNINISTMDITVEPDMLSPDSATGSTEPTDLDAPENKFDGDLCESDRFSVDSGLSGSKSNLLDSSTERWLSPDASRVTSGDEEIAGRNKIPGDADISTSSPIFSYTDSGIVQTDASQKCKFMLHTSLKIKVLIFFKLKDICIALKLYFLNYISDNHLIRADASKNSSGGMQDIMRTTKSRSRDMTESVRAASRPRVRPDKYSMVSSDATTSPIHVKTLSEPVEHISHVSENVRGALEHVRTASEPVEPALSTPLNEIEDTTPRLYQTTHDPKTKYLLERSRMYRDAIAGSVNGEKRSAVYIMETD